MIWNFEGYPRNSMLNFWGLIKNEVEFPKRWPRKNVELPGVFVFGLGISKWSNTILWNIQGMSYVLSGISRGKVKKVRNSRGVFKKVYLQPPCLDSFWNSPFQGICKSNNHFFQGLLVFKNLLAHTPVWIKNGIAQWIRPTRLTNHVYLLLLEVTAKTFCCTQRDDAKEK